MVTSLHASSNLANATNSLSSMFSSPKNSTPLSNTSRDFTRLKIQAKYMVKCAHMVKQILEFLILVLAGDFFWEPLFGSLRTGAWGQNEGACIARQNENRLCVVYFLGTPGLFVNRQGYQLQFSVFNYKIAG